ncbi:MAG: o-succinylbenzoate synthase [Cyclobacteriaceae bacterium]
MKLKLDFSPYILDFRFDAGTSRGVMKQRKTWFLKVCESENPDHFGIGECAPLPGLSTEDISQIDFELERMQKIIGECTLKTFTKDPLEKISELTDPSFPSVRFGLETAILDLINGAKRIIYDNAFTRGQLKIPINGLIWMGEKSFMHQQVDEKMAAGFECVKMKVGAIDFADEIELLKNIRKRGGDKLDLRIDANGAFSNREIFKIIRQLDQIKLHSIEQPIMPRQPEAMSLICEKSTIPIALDEDLIGIHTKSGKIELLDYVKPQYIVIKPSLVGGLKSTAEWIALAEERGIGWWITSALESNVGLNAIAQLTAEYSVSMHQGLGTGQLYHNNVKSPLHIENGYLQYVPGHKWNLDPLLIS